MSSALTSKAKTMPFRPVVYGSSHVTQLEPVYNGDADLRVLEMKFISERGITAAMVRPELLQKLLDYRQTHSTFIFGGNDITFTSNPMVIYRCIWNCIDKVQEMVPCAFGFCHVLHSETLGRILLNLTDRLG